MLLAALAKSTPLVHSLDSHPRWLLAAGATVVLAAALWLLSKLLKWTLLALLVAVLVGGVVVTAWLLVNS